jgi:hypothetical protein
MRTMKNLMGIACLGIATSLMSVAKADPPSLPQQNAAQGPRHEARIPEAKIPARTVPHAAAAEMADLASAAQTPGAPTVTSANGIVGGAVVTHASLASIASTHGQEVPAPASAEREVAPPTVEPPPPVAKAPAGPRALRRMGAQHALVLLKPALQECYVAGGPGGTVLVRANTSATGEVESTEIVSNSGLAASVASCVVERVSAARFGAPGGSGVSVIVPVQLGPTS